MNKYKHVRVGILGVSTEGVDSAMFFLSRGAQVTCLDRRTEEMLGKSANELLELGARLQLGKQYLQHLDSFDILIRSPGVSPRLPELEVPRDRGTVITSQTQVFMEECRGRVIGVTGTKGKGTTSTLIARMIEADGKKAWLGGNVGKPLLSQVDSIGVDDWVVLELSSFQLEDVTLSPHIAVVLRITQDHLQNFDKLATNFHPTRDHYVAAKSQIVRHQKSSDVVIVNADDSTSSGFAKLTPAKAKRFSLSGNRLDAWVAEDVVYVAAGKRQEEVCRLSEIKLRGRHNLENIAAASLAVLSAGATLAAIRKVCLEFTGLPYRLETVREWNGITFVNDSFSTVPETAIAALRAYDSPVIPILGGSEKGSDFSELGAVVAELDVPVTIVIGDMTERICRALQDAGYKGKIVTGLQSMKEIVAAAVRYAQSGYVVLLSPASASFDMFPNYKERGNQFTYEVKQLSS